MVKKALEFKTIFKKRLNETEAIVKALKTTAMTSLDKQEQMEFGNLITCHFSSEEIPRLENVKLEEAIRNSVKALGYEVNAQYMQIMFLFDRFKFLMEIFAICVLAFRHTY